MSYISLSEIATSEGMAKMKFRCRRTSNKKSSKDQCIPRKAILICMVNMSIRNLWTQTLKLGSQLSTSKENNLFLKIIRILSDKKTKRLPVLRTTTTTIAIANPKTTNLSSPNNLPHEIMARAMEISIKAIISLRNFR